MKTILIMGTMCLTGILLSCGEQTKSGISFNFYGLEQTFAMMHAGFADGEDFIVKVDPEIPIAVDQVKADQIKPVAVADRLPETHGPENLYRLYGGMEEEREDPVILEELDLPKLFEDSLESQE